MNWFDTSGLTSLAKNALKEAQKTIDKALDIQDEEQEDQPLTESKDKTPAGGSNAPQKDSSDFFASWGLTVSAESANDEAGSDQPVVTESPAKATTQSVWGSFAGSFFEPPKPEDSTLIRPPKAKSMNVISDAKYDSQDDLFSKSQLVMSESEGLEHKVKAVESPKPDERRGSSRSNRLSLVSSRNSSDSVEVLSQSLKTTPDSEASAQSMSHSSSVGHKLNSESVEILPDSLVSPSSIECLGFDSYSSERNSSSSSNLSPDVSDKKSTPVGDRTGRVETADSVSLVADDDEDTMSYNSVSECTAPTVLDTDDKSTSPFPRPIRCEPQRKGLDKEFVHLEQPIIPLKMQISENSSNDGSWSDRTLNADNDSIILDTTLEEHRRELDQEDIFMEKLSNSSSFYNVHVSSTEMLRSESSAFVNVEKQQCNAPDSSESSQKDGSIKERISPISSDGKSDLVKIGSDRTSGHTSGDELETATSSDIEIIPSPNGDSGHSFCRNSPAKYGFKQAKFDGTTSPNLVDLVLGKSLATKIRGHNRELSEASVQSNTSDESQGSENDRLMRRLCEMAEILEARENRLMEVSRNNAELAESNADLKSQMESLLSKHEVGDMITEDYTQRMSALEKKFQQAIREKDQLRKQLDNIKSESSRKNLLELENTLKERDEVIAQMQEEGEKLSRQQLQQSNIIKKFRTKDKDNEQVIKNLRDKISEQTSELDRVKRSLAAKEDVEVSQIEAVYRLTTANKRLDTELMEVGSNNTQTRFRVLKIDRTDPRELILVDDKVEYNKQEIHQLLNMIGFGNRAGPDCPQVYLMTKSALDDTSQRLESTRTSLDAARRELGDLQRSSAELQRRRGAAATLEADKEAAEREAERLRREVQQLRAELVQEEKRWISREDALRRELSEARELCSMLEARGLAAGEGAGEASAALLAQLAALQRAAIERDHAHANTTRSLAKQLAQAEQSVTKAAERERLAREESQALAERLAASEALLQDAQGRLEALAAQCQHVGRALAQLEGQLDSKSRELERAQADHETEVSQLRARLSEAEKQLAGERDALETEKKRYSILQEQASARGDISPPHSVASDSFSASLWPQEDGSITPTSVPLGTPAPASAMCVEETLAQLTRREGEVRALGAAAARARQERDAMRAHIARLQADLDECRTVQEQYDALLQMYGEKEEQLEEVKLDLQDVTLLYKQQLDELIALRRQAGAGAGGAPR